MHKLSSPNNQALLGFAYQQGTPKYYYLGVFPININIMESFWFKILTTRHLNLTPSSTWINAIITYLSC